MRECQVLSNIGIVAIENNRSKAYLQRLEHAGLAPAFAVLLSSPTGIAVPGQQAVDLGATAASSERIIDRDSPFCIDPSESAESTLRRTGTEMVKIQTTDINDGTLAAVLEARPEQIWIFSGPGGAILRRPLFAIGKQYLHVHPGLVPQYRGSTTLYYSILQENFCGASAIFLGPQIDTGDLIATKTWPAPADPIQIDYLVDPLLRSELLVEVLCRYHETGSFVTSVQPPDGTTYYIIHPLLKHLAILGARWSLPAGNPPQKTK